MSYDPERWNQFMLKRAEAQARARVSAQYRATRPRRPPLTFREALRRTTSPLAIILHERSASALAAAKQWREANVAKVRSPSPALGGDPLREVQKGVGS